MSRGKDCDVFSKDFICLGGKTKTVMSGGESISWKRGSLGFFSFGVTDTQGISNLYALLSLHLWDCYGQYFIGKII